MHRAYRGRPRLGGGRRSLCPANPDVAAGDGHRHHQTPPRPQHGYAISGHKEWVVTICGNQPRTHAHWNRLIVTEVDVAVFAVAFRGPMGWLPNRLPAALARSGFRSRCRPVGSRRGVARKRRERLQIRY